MIRAGFAPAPIFLDTDLGLNRVWKTEWEMLPLLNSEWVIWRHVEHLNEGLR